MQSGGRPEGRDMIFGLAVTYEIEQKCHGKRGRQWTPIGLSLAKLSHAFTSFKSIARHLWLSFFRMAIEGVRRVTTGERERGQGQCP